MVVELRSLQTHKPGANFGQADLPWYKKNMGLNGWTDTSTHFRSSGLRFEAPFSRLAFDRNEGTLLIQTPYPHPPEIIILCLGTLDRPNSAFVLGGTLVQHHDKSEDQSETRPRRISFTCLRVKIKPPGIGPQVLVHVSIHQGWFWGDPIFDPRPLLLATAGAVTLASWVDWKRRKKQILFAAQMVQTGSSRFERLEWGYPCFRWSIFVWEPSPKKGGKGQYWGI